MDWMEYGAAALILLFAYFVRGLSGFGSGLIAVPLLAHLMPLPLVVPFMQLLDFSGSLIMSRSFRRHIAWDELKPLLPASLLGMVLGTWLLVGLPSGPLLLVLGLFVIVFGLRGLLNLHGEKPVSRGWAHPAGFTGAAVGAMFGTGGPPYVIYLTHRIRDKSVLRATFSALFLVLGATQLTFFTLAGLVTLNTLLAALAGAPLLALGIWLGHKAHVGISQAAIFRLIGAILLLSGASLLWKAFS